MRSVRAWKDKLIIPTYEIGEPEKYPMFLDKRVYQGSSGAVYPHPVIEQISNEKIDKEWDVVYIENEYIKIMVLPALGGRIQMAYDKIRQRHFVYYNHVIKPALVGLTGPWISGGIEFNWPQHHRPSTYDPIDYLIEDNDDGSVTVWVSELERMFRTKGMAGFTLYPDKAYLEVKVKLYNRTPHAQTFLWWANPAVSVNDHYQSVFPPDVNAVFDHGRRDVSEFPIAKGKYYKVDYAPGTDISRYKNIPVPTSYMAASSRYDFIGGYENDTKAGMLHIADHNISQGKKQWTWGNGDFGQAWDRNLTDSDGPYAELMCGVYTDNQPDFSWMYPYEEKSFKQYFMPYVNVGTVKNATKDALINLEVKDNNALIKVYVTAPFPQCAIILSSPSQILFSETIDLSPEISFEKTVALNTTENEILSVVLKDCNDTILVSWTNETSALGELPQPAKAAKEPAAIESIEELYLQGLHLEQYRHATFDATAYYLEALSRQPGDVRNNNAMGLWNLRRGQFEKALSFFEKAIETLTQHNPNPYDGEPFFNKGLALKYLGRLDEAYTAFYKACWNAAWQDAGYFNLAQIDCARGNFAKALELVDKSLVRNTHNHKALHLKIMLLRKLGRDEEAHTWINTSLAIDPFNFGALFEKYKVTLDEDDLTSVKQLLRDYAHNYIEISIDYAQAGDWETAIQILDTYSLGKEKIYPMVSYFLGWYYEQQNDIVHAALYYRRAQDMPMDFCFPNRLEEVIVLQSAAAFHTDAKASYYLGNFWYASKQFGNAQQCWEASIAIDDQNPICHRNLALLYFNKTNQKELAQEHLEQAFKLDNKSARILMELDQLYKKINASLDTRLNLLEGNLSLTLSRDDLYLELITLYNFKGRNCEALKLLEKRQFHPWEGGEGKVPFAYKNVLIELAKTELRAGECQEALDHLMAAQQYPHNLGEGKLFGAQENDVNYWLGCVYERLDDQTSANECWHMATKGLSEPTQAMFYNDQQPDTIFYQGLAFVKLGEDQQARLLFEKLVAYGETHMDDQVKLDYFAVSLPDLLIWEEDLTIRNVIHCTYLIGLGEYGLNNMGAAYEAFKRVTELDTYHLPSHVLLNMLAHAKVDEMK